MTSSVFLYLFFFFNDTATTEIYTLSLHDALPISSWRRRVPSSCACCRHRRRRRDRKSTRLNSSHVSISYAVFCLKKKKEGRRTVKREIGNDSGACGQGWGGVG